MPSAFPDQGEGLKSFHGYLKEIDGMLAGRQWLGDGYSVLDPYAFVFYTWGVRRELPMGELKNYTAYKDRMLKRPAVAARGGGREAQGVTIGAHARLGCLDRPFFQIEEFCYAARWKRVAEKKSLHLIAPDGFQQLFLFVSFHAFGRRFHVERAR